MVLSPSSLSLTQVRCTPGRSHSAWTTGDAALVAATRICAPATASSAASTATTSVPVFSAISLAKLSRCALVGLKTCTRLIFRTAHIAGTCAPACQPEPNIPRTGAFGTAMRAAARALVTATRRRCITPSGKIASGSPVSAENNSTSPTHLPPGAFGSLSLTVTPARFSQRMTSELRRSATTGGSARPPSIDLKA